MLDMTLLGWLVWKPQHKPFFLVLDKAFGKKSAIILMFDNLTKVK